MRNHWFALAKQPFASTLDLMFGSGVKKIPAGSLEVSIMDNKIMCDFINVSTGLVLPEKRYL